MVTEMRKEDEMFERRSYINVMPISGDNQTGRAVLEYKKNSGRSCLVPPLLFLLSALASSAEQSMPRSSMPSVFTYYIST